MKRVISIFLLAVEIVTAVELVLVLLEYPVRIRGFLACVFGLCILFCLIHRISDRAYMLSAITLAVLFAVSGAVGFVSYRLLANPMTYISVDDGKKDLYSDKRVMLIVPHQDDDMNVAGGVMEQYEKYGSEVFVVFVTNGDYYDNADLRLQEAVRACKAVGVAEEHVIFLGYGDQWSPNGCHIYNAEPGQIMTSFAGYTSTYGTTDHAAFREGHLYTVDNLLLDMKDVILEYRPDTIICSDYDYHIEHKATSLIFEKAMGQILQEEPGYTPVVLKAFAYNAAWRAEPDYFSLNIHSTNNVFEHGDWIPAVYDWEQRIRFPVDASILSRSLLRSKAYDTLTIYESQHTETQADSVINGDRVYWHRRTDSLLYSAEVTSTSGDAGLLHDFMLLDSKDLLDDKHLPYDGTWIPAANDQDRTITVTLENRADIFEIVLFDNPSESDNVMNAVITFDNGTVVQTGRLSQIGTRICVNQKNVRSFTVMIESAEGHRAGITEMEAYSQSNLAPFSFIKLMDESCDFVYDYATDSSGFAALQLYAFGNELKALTPNDYGLSCDNVLCSAEIIDDRIHVHCPEDEVCVVTLWSLINPDIRDRVFIQNPTPVQRGMIECVHRIEELHISGLVEDVSLYKLAATAYSILRSL